MGKASFDTKTYTPSMGVNRYVVDVASDAQTRLGDARSPDPRGRLTEVVAMFLIASDQPPVEDRVEGGV